MTRSMLLVWFVVGCAPSFASPLRRPDGSWHLQCGASLDRCVNQAEQLCKGRGYVVLSGLSRRNLYGAELGASQVEVREAELDIACADRRGDLPNVTYPGPLPRLERPTVSLPDASATPPSAPPAPVAPPAAAAPPTPVAPPAPAPPAPVVPAPAH